MTTYSITPVGVVRSPLTALKDAPKQSFEGGADAWVDVDATVGDALHGLAVGDEVILITWFHLSDRAVLKVHPRSDPRRPLTGVFATRSPARPNPLGLHRVRVLEMNGTSLKVGPLEAIDGTPVVDIKPVMSESDDA